MTNTSPKPFVFVLMPFAEQFSELYQFGIKLACQDAGAYCERVNDQNFLDDILERIYNQIAKADVIVSEMTGCNPNVFYETGYAHALNKRVILLTQNAEDIPFDLKHYPHIVYGGKLSILKPELEKNLCWCIENPTGLVPKIDSSLEFFLGSVPLVGAPEIEVSYWPEVDEGSELTGRVTFGINMYIHNQSNRLVDPKSFDLALICPPDLHMDSTSEFRSEIMVKGQRFYNFHLLAPMFPDSWDKIALKFFSWSEDFQRRLTIGLRLFTELGTKDYPFTLQLIPREEAFTIPSPPD